MLAAERAYLDWVKDPCAFAEKGRILKTIVDSENSVNAIGEMYKVAAEMSLNP